MAPSIQSLDDHDPKKTKADAAGERPMETVGVYLKKERESKNLSLHEVAQLTKISELYLDCIEKDDYEKIPKGPYVKGYISSYSRMIGGDTEQALKLYESVNKQKNQLDETEPAIPAANGWKASMAMTASSLINWLTERKKSHQTALSQPLETGVQPHPATSLSEKRKASAEVAHPTETENRPPVDTAEKAESSVLIPFKKFAPHSQASEPIINAPEPVAKKKGFSVKSVITSIHRKLDGFLGVALPWVKNLFLKVTTHSWPLPSRSLLVIVAALLVGSTVLVFCGFGVYHVFFFNKQTTMTSDSEAAPSAPSQLTVPHKTARFTKPDSPLPAVAVVNAPPPVVQRPTLTVQQPPPTQPVVDGKNRLPAKTKETAASSEAKAKPPADINVKVLRATICSEIKDRMPADTTTAFPLSVERVYVWSHVQADRYPTTIRHIYYHEGQLINKVELSIRSPFWRTWSFKSIDKDRYRGHWRVDITSMDEKLLRRLFFEIN